MIRKNALAYSLVAACSLLALPARGECVPEDAAGPGADCVALNKGGVWLSDAKADEVSKAYALAPELQKKVAKQAELAESQTEQITLLWRALEARTKQADEGARLADEATKIAERVNLELAAERDRASAWYRSWWFGATVGAVVAGAAATAVVMVIK